MTATIEQTLPRIERGLSEQQYNDLPAVRSSHLKLVWQSPAIYAREMRERTSTKALDMGGALHAFMLLSEDRYHASVAVSPECDRRTKDGKAQWAEFCEANAGKIIISQAEQDLIEELAAAVFSNDKAGPMLRASRPDQRELSLLWEDSGTPCKARMDIVSGAYCMDIKTMAGDVEAYECAKAVRKYHYHLSAAFYLDGARACGLPVTHFAFIFVSKSTARVRVWVLNDETMEYGRRAYKSALRAYEHCQQTGKWPDFPQVTMEDCILDARPYPEDFMQRELALSNLAGGVL